MIHVLSDDCSLLQRAKDMESYCSWSSPERLNPGRQGKIQSLTFALRKQIPCSDSVTLHVCARNRCLCSSVQIKNNNPCDSAPTIQADHHAFVHVVYWFQSVGIAFRLFCRGFSFISSLRWSHQVRTRDGHRQMHKRRRVLPRCVMLPFVPRFMCDLDDALH